MSREDSIQQRAGEHLSMRDKVLRRGFSRDKGRGATGSWRVEGAVWDYDVNEHQGDSSFSPSWPCSQAPHPFASSDRFFRAGKRKAK